MTEAKFKIGDKVRCIKPADDLVYGKEYNVTFVNDNEARTLISVEGTGYTGGYYEHRFELVEAAPEPFTKDSLKTGMRVVLRDGRTFIVMKDVDGVGYIVSESCHNPLDYYTEGLEEKYGSTRLDIVEVYSFSSQSGLLNLREKGTLLWKRETPEQKRVKEINEEIKALEKERAGLLNQ